MFKLIYLSGAGHSWQAARWFQKALAATGQAGQLAALEETGPETVGPGPWGLFYPVYGFSPPWLLLPWLWRLPRGNGQKVFLVNTRGAIKIGRHILWGVSGLALWLPGCILALKGYRPQSLSALEAPSNWVTAHPGASKATAEFMLERARPRLEFLAGITPQGRRSIEGKLWAGLVFDLLLLPVSLFYLLVGRLVLAKLFVASPACDLCRQCAANCPAGAIILKPRPYWRHRCLSCLRCLNNCPRAAIYPAYPPLVISLAGFMAVRYGLGPAWWSWLTALMFFLVLIFISYPIMRYLAGRFDLGRWISPTVHWPWYSWRPGWKFPDGPPDGPTANGE